MANTGMFCFLVDSAEERDELIFFLNTLVGQDLHLKNIEIHIIPRNITGPQIVCGEIDQLTPRYSAKFPEKFLQKAFMVNSTYGDNWIQL